MKEDEIFDYEGDEIEVLAEVNGERSDEENCDEGDFNQLNQANGLAHGKIIYQCVL